MRCMRSKLEGTQNGQQRRCGDEGGRKWADGNSSIANKGEGDHENIYAVFDTTSKAEPTRSPTRVSGHQRRPQSPGVTITSKTAQPSEILLARTGRLIAGCVAPLIIDMNTI